MRDQINEGRLTIKPSELLGRENENVYVLVNKTKIVGFVTFDQIEQDGLEFIAWFFMPLEGHLFSFDGGMHVDDFVEFEQESDRAQALMRLYSELKPTECRVINLYMVHSHENHNKPPLDLKVI